MPASSLVSNPTRTLGSVWRGNLRNTASSVAGLSFAAQPAAFAIEVSFTDEVKPYLAVERFDYKRGGAVRACAPTDPGAGIYFRRPNAGSDPLQATSQPAAASVDVFACASAAASTALAVISSPFLFISNL